MAKGISTEEGEEGGNPSSQPFAKISESNLKEDNDKHNRNFWHKLIKQREGIVKVFVVHVIFYVFGWLLFAYIVVNNWFIFPNYSLLRVLLGFYFLGNIAVCVFYYLFKKEKDYYELETNNNKKPSDSPGAVISDKKKALDCADAETAPGNCTFLKSTFGIIWKVLAGLFGITELKWVWENFSTYGKNLKIFRDAFVIKSFGDIEDVEIDAFIKVKIQLCEKAILTLVSTFFRTLPIGLLFLCITVIPFQLPHAICSLEIFQILSVLIPIVSAAAAISNYNKHAWDLRKAIEFKDHLYNRSNTKEKIKGNFRGMFSRFCEILKISGEIATRFVILGYLLTKTGGTLSHEIFSFLGMMMIYNLVLPQIPTMISKDALENLPFGSSGIISATQQLTRWIGMSCFHGLKRTFWNITFHNVGLIFILLYVVFLVDSNTTSNSTDVKYPALICNQINNTLNSFSRFDYCMHEIDPLPISESCTSNDTVISINDFFYYTTGTQIFSSDLFVVIFTCVNVGLNFIYYLYVGDDSNNYCSSDNARRNFQAFFNNYVCGKGEQNEGCFAKLCPSCSNWCRSKAMSFFSCLDFKDCNCSCFPCCCGNGSNNDSEDAFATEMTKLPSTSNSTDDTQDSSIEQKLTNITNGDNEQSEAIASSSNDVPIINGSLVTDETDNNDITATTTVDVEAEADSNSNSFDITKFFGKELIILREKTESLGDPDLLVKLEAFTEKLKSELPHLTSHDLGTIRRNLATGWFCDRKQCHKGRTNVRNTV